MRDESNLPPGIDADKVDAGNPVGYVLPLKAASRAKAANATTWHSSVWPLRRGKVFLTTGDSPMGYRLPLSSLPARLPDEDEADIPADPFERRDALGQRKPAKSATAAKHGTGKRVSPGSREVVKTALCIEVRAGKVYLFLPPLALLEDFITLVAAIEATVRALGVRVRMEGYAPPDDTRLGRFAVTPDPGVIEVNIHPAASWDELRQRIEVLYEEARLARLGTDKFMLDGRHTGTGGGNHVTLGAASAADSPLLRRPDLLQSLITFGRTIRRSHTFSRGPSSGPRANRRAWTRRAATRCTNSRSRSSNWMRSSRPASPMRNRGWWIASCAISSSTLRVIRIAPNSPSTSSTHRAVPQAAGIAGASRIRDAAACAHEPRADPAAACVDRALLVAALSRQAGPLGHAPARRIHAPPFRDPGYRDVVRELSGAGYKFKLEWLAPFIEFRFPRYGSVSYEGTEIELRQAIEPWHVLGEEVTRVGASRYVDSSIERLQVKATRLNPTRHAIACNGRLVPMTATGRAGEFVAGVRYRAWAPPSALHPTIGIHAPLVFDLVDLWNQRSIGGCTYHVTHPGGRSYGTFPVNALEAEARRVARFQAMGHTPGPMEIEKEARNPSFPTTLDLRRNPEPAI